MSSLLQNKTNIKTIIGWVISICIPLILFLIPCTEIYTYDKNVFRNYCFLYLMYGFR